MACSKSKSNTNPPPGQGQLRPSTEQNKRQKGPSSSKESWPKIFARIAKNRNLMSDFILIAKDDKNGKEQRFPVIITWIALRSDGIAREFDRMEDKTQLELVLPNVTPRILDHALHVRNHVMPKKAG
jgi:hypothetical protein